MKIKSFLEDVMKENIVSNYDVRILIERANKISNLFEIYIKKEDDIYLHIDFRFRESVKEKYSIKEIERVFLEDKEDYLFVISQLKNNKQIALNSILLNPKNLDDSDLLIKKIEFVTNEIYHPDEIWGDTLNNNFIKKCSALTSKHYSYEVNHLKELMRVFIDEYIKLIQDKLVKLLRENYNNYIKNEKKKEILSEKINAIKNKKFVFIEPEYNNGTLLDLIINKGINKILGYSKEEIEKQKIQFNKNKEVEIDIVLKERENLNNNLISDKLKVNCLLRDFSSNLIIFRNEGEYLKDLKLSLDRNDRMIPDSSSELLFDCLILLKDKENNKTNKISANIRKDFYRNFSEKYMGKVNQEEYFTHLNKVLLYSNSKYKRDLVNYILKKFEV